MQAALKSDVITVEDYLAGEEASEAKHEYIGGVVYAMDGTTIQHNLIIQNIAFAARAHLKGRPCKVLIADVKVRLDLQQQDVFYYPDVMVGCDPRDTNRLYLRHPKILVEVSSDSTERIDRHEKRSAYQSIETLEDYVMAAQDRIEVTLFRRSNNWNPEVFNRPDQSLSLKSIEFVLPLSSVYEGVVVS
jgi:Uma2 family endonuclease